LNNHRKNQPGLRRKMLNMRFIASCVVFLTLFPSAFAQQPRQRVSVDEAKDLVLAALPAKTKRLPRFGLEGGVDPTYPHFYIFMAYWEGAPNGSMVIGHYAVDFSTADVWNAVMACEELSTAALQKMQMKIRSRIGLSNSDYRKIKGTCPLETKTTTPFSK
jgi:hypothetical protein